MLSLLALTVFGTGPGILAELEAKIFPSEYLLLMIDHLQIFRPSADPDIYRDVGRSKFCGGNILYISVSTLFIIGPSKLQNQEIPHYSSKKPPYEGFVVVHLIIRNLPWSSEKPEIPTFEATPQKTPMQWGFPDVATLMVHPKEV